MIWNIIFDMGGVLIDWDLYRIMERCGAAREDYSTLLTEIFCGPEWPGMDRGFLTLQEGCARICRRLPERLHAVAASCVLDWWKIALVSMPGMADLIREVKTLGFGIYLLSNATPALHEYFPAIAGSEYFDGKIVSSDLHLLKPQHEIYEALFQTFDLRPESCFFIDDSNLNIEAAENLGMPGAVFFHDLPRLRRELREAGVPVSEASSS